MITATKTQYSHYKRKKPPTTITYSDFLRIKNEIVPSNEELERRKAYDERLKEISKNRAKNWPDSLEMKKKYQLEFTKRKFLEEENRRRKIDEEEAKFQKIQNNLVVERAKNLLFMEQEPVKRFNATMMYCDMLKEREFQDDIKQKKKSINDLIEKKFYEQELKKMEEYDKKELEKKRLEELKRMERMKIINEQLQESKIKRVQDYQEKIVEGELMKIAMKNALEEDKRKEEELKRLKAEQKQQFINSNIELEKLKEEKKRKELEEDKKIEEFAFKKQQLEDLRKKVENDKFKEKQAQRQKLIDAQIEYLTNLKNQEEARIEKSIKESEEKKQAEEKKKQDRFNMLQAEIKQQREDVKRKKEEQKLKEKNEDMKFVEEWKNKMKLLEQQERDEKIAKKIRDKNLAEYQRLQLEEKKRIAKADFYKLNEDAYKIKYQLGKEDDDFIKYAEYWIREYKKQGKNINPMLLELKSYKKQNNFQ